MAGDRQESDAPRESVARMRGLLRETREEISKEAGSVGDPRARALFETASEVLGGLITAHQHYESGIEEAWRGDASGTGQPEKAEHPTQPAEGGDDEARY